MGCCKSTQTSVEPGPLKSTLPSPSEPADGPQPVPERKSLNLSDGSKEQLLPSIPCAIEDVPPPFRPDSIPRISRTNSACSSKEKQPSSEHSRQNSLGSAANLQMQRRLSRGEERRPSLEAKGRPFPKRPWGAKLGEETWKKLEELFRRMDPDGSNAVSKEEAHQFFSGGFGKLSVDAMFNEVDVDNSGAITADEFMQFWQDVRKKGYKEHEVLEEVEELLAGGAWVDWKDDRNTTATKVKFPKRPFMCRLNVKTWQACEDLFRKIDGDGSLTITREKALSHFKASFSSSSADAMFNEIDLLHHGNITPKEWMKFWVQVRASGYKDREIQDELEMLMEGDSWVDWSDGRTTA